MAEIDTLRSEVLLLRAKLARMVKCDRCSELNSVLREKVQSVSTDIALPEDVRAAARVWLDR